MKYEKITRGNKNIFADLGVKNPEEWQCKAKLAAEIMRIIKENGWTQTKAAEYLKIKQTQISNIRRGQFDRFTIDRLMQYLMKLNRDVQILVQPHNNKDNSGRIQSGHMAVICAV